MRNKEMNTKDNLSCLFYNCSNQCSLQYQVNFFLVQYQVIFPMQYQVIFPVQYQVYFPNAISSLFSPQKAKNKP